MPKWYPAKQWREYARQSASHFKFIETPRNLAEYRIERIETVKRQVLGVAEAHLQSRTDGEFTAVFNDDESSVHELKLYIMQDGFDVGLVTTPERVVTEVAIDIANALAQDSNLPYTIDMSTGGDNPRYIRIVKL